MAGTTDWASSTLDNNNTNPSSSDTHQSLQPHDHRHDPSGRLQSIPPWIITPDTRASQLRTPNLQLPQSPVIPHHQCLPEPQRGRTARGRRWDHLRNAEPPLLDQTLEQSSHRWLTVMQSGPQYNPSELNNTTLMSDEWMEENVPFWTVDRQLEDDHIPAEKHQSIFLNKERRRGCINNVSRTIMKNPFVPLLFRTITATFTIAALALGARVFSQTKTQAEIDQCDQRASTYISIVVDAIAVPYIIYITWDEYTSKPLGLRSATAKTALLLVDLYFIVFYSSTLSLAFQALTDTRWACYSNKDSTCTQSLNICRSQRGLAAVLLVALVAWMTTFSISVLRVVKRLRPDE